MALIRFGEWTPDQPDLDNEGGLVTANRCYAVKGGYRVFPTNKAGPFSATGVSLAGVILAKGAVSYNDNAGASRTYVGNDNNLFKLTLGAVSNKDGSASFSIVSSATAEFSLNHDSFWEFAKWQNTVIAVSPEKEPQQIIMDDAQLFTDLQTLGAEAPKARHLAVVRSFVVLGNTNDTTDGVNGSRIWWSAIDDANNWPTPGTSTAAQVQSDFQDLPQSGAGWVQRIIGGDVGYIFQERAITEMRYIGGTAVFSFRNVDKQRGLQYEGALATVGGRTYYRSADGFYMFDGATSHPIGHGRVDDFFLEDLDDANNRINTRSRNGIQIIQRIALPDSRE